MSAFHIGIGFASESGQTFFKPACAPTLATPVDYAYGTAVDILDSGAFTLTASNGICRFKCDSLVDRRLHEQ